MYERYAYSYCTVKELAKEFDATESTIYRTIKRVGELRSKKKAAAILSRRRSEAPAAVLNAIQRDKRVYARYAVQFGNGLRKWRWQRRLSQRELSERVGIEFSKYAQFERGDRHPSFYSIMRLSYALQVNPARLFDEVVIEY